MIESTIRDYPGITDCVAVVKHYSESVILIIAYVVCRPELEFEDLKRHLKSELPAYMIPRKFKFVEAFPMTSNGKADRRKLAELI